MLKVICIEDFYVEALNSKYYFIKGRKYNYYNDGHIDWLCDEQVQHRVDDVYISDRTFRKMFILLDKYRDNQINTIV